MKRSLERRLEAVEERQAQWKASTESRSSMEVARRILFLMSKGEAAMEELDAADASLGPDRRAKLTGILKAAREVAKTIADFSPNSEPPLSARPQPPLHTI